MCSGSETFAKFHSIERTTASVAYFVFDSNCWQTKCLYWFNRFIVTICHSGFCPWFSFFSCCSNRLLNALCRPADPVYRRRQRHLGTYPFRRQIEHKRTQHFFSLIHFALNWNWASIWIQRLYLLYYQLPLHRRHPDILAFSREAEAATKCAQHLPFIIFVSFELNCVGPVCGRSRVRIFVCLPSLVAFVSTV